MPLYDYRCDTCQKVFEVEQPITADPIAACVTPNCPGPVRRLISKVGIAFKGSGFYVTDSGGTTTGTPPASTPATSSESAKN